LIRGLRRQLVVGVAKQQEAFHAWRHSSENLLSLRKERPQVVWATQEDPSLSASSPWTNTISTPSPKRERGFFVPQSRSFFSSLSASRLVCGETAPPKNFHLAQNFR
jgi:hypothetical protein